MSTEVKRKTVRTVRMDERLPSADYASIGADINDGLLAIHIHNVRRSDRGLIHAFIDQAFNEQEEA